jgi:hypothetical protein
MSTPSKNTKWFVIACHVELAVWGLGLAGAGPLLFWRWWVAGPFWPPAWPKAVTWIFIAFTLLSPVVLTWFAFEVARTAAARAGWRWGRESKIVQFRPQGRLLDLAIGPMIFLGSLCALIPLSNPGFGLACSVLAVSVTLLGAALGMCSFLWAWDERQRKKAELRTQRAGENEGPAQL